MTFQPGAMLYTSGFGSRPENVEVPHIDVRGPSVSDVLYPIGKQWVDATGKNTYFLVGLTSSNGITSAVWEKVQSSSGSTPLISISDNTNTPTFASVTGNIQLNGVSNQISVISNPLTNQIQLGITNPVDLMGAAFSGDVNFTATSGISVQSGAGWNFGNLPSFNGGFVVAAGTGNFNGGVNIAATSLAQPNEGLILNSGTLSVINAVNLTGGTYNCLGGEGVIKCSGTSPIVINLISTFSPGSYITIYDAIGNAAVNSITINAPSGGSILKSNVAPALNYVINLAYGNVVLYYIPGTLDFLVLNH